MNILVKLSREENLAFFHAQMGQVVSMDMEDYVRGVVPAEVGNAPLEACKAQAVAARTYALPFALKGDAITDQSSVNQAYRAPRSKDPAYANAHAGVAATVGEVLHYGGKLINTCSYSASNGGRTVAADERWKNPRAWLLAKDDPWDRAATGGVKRGHGVGMSQAGAKYAAATLGLGYRDILAFYYTGTAVVQAYGEAQEPAPVEPAPTLPDPAPEKPEGVLLPPEMGVLIQSNMDCYTKGRKITPRGIVVHSTGANNPMLKRYVGPDDGVLGHNKNGNHWNKPGHQKGANAFIGKTENGEVMIYQTLPWDWRPWLCGKGPKGTYNDSHVQFEMCEDGLANEAYWRAVRAQAVHLCAWLCQVYGIDVQDVVGHYEAHKAGYANNHGDPQNWMKKFGDSMDAFRADVRKMLVCAGGIVPPEPEPEPEGMFVPYMAKVVTKSTPLGLWDSPRKGRRIAEVPRGAMVQVVGAGGAVGWYRTVYDGAEGVADGQYLEKV